jgi:hypothetical protein
MATRAEAERVLAELRVVFADRPMAFEAARRIVAYHTPGVPDPDHREATR